MAVRSKSSGNLCIGLLTIPFSLQPVRQGQALALGPSDAPDVLSEEERTRVLGARTGRLEITEFVPATSLDPRFVLATHWLVPSQAAERAHALVAQSLVRSRRLGVGRLELADRDVLAIVQPWQGGLLVHACASANDVLAQGGEPFGNALALRPLELELAERLIASMARDAFDPGAFQDESSERLEAARRHKLAGQTIEPFSVPARPLVVDTLEALKRSVHAAELAKSDAPPPSVVKGPKKAAVREALDAKGRRKRAASR